MSTDTRDVLWAKPPTAKKASFSCFDIESLSNAFTLCLYNRKNHTLDCYYLFDDPALDTFDVATADRIIREKNPALIHLGSWNPNPVAIRFKNLKATDQYGQLVNINDLATTFGLTDAQDVHTASRWIHISPDERQTLYEAIAGPLNTHQKCREIQTPHYGTFDRRFIPVTDLSPHYDPYLAHPYLVGYNSNQYDTTILAAFFALVFQESPYGNQPYVTASLAHVSAQKMRQINDALFTDYRTFMPKALADHSLLTKRPNNYDTVAWRIRRNLINSGRHIDATAFNETQKKVSFKRLSGLRGRQILESDRLSGHNTRLATLEDVYELFAYNTSDVVGLHQIMSDTVYSNSFNAKLTLINENPETIFKKGQRTITNVKPKRLTVDSSSAKIVAAVLAPYDSLQDDPKVSFVYPHAEIARQLTEENENGITIEPQDILEDTMAFFRQEIGQYDAEAMSAFQAVYDYYKALSQLNVNAENTHPDAPPYQSLASVAVPNLNLPYYRLIKNPDGSTRVEATDTFVTFSVGGIHGAQYNLNRFTADDLNYQMVLMERQLIAACLLAPGEVLPGDTEQERMDALALRFKLHGNITLPTGEVLLVKDYLAASSTKTAASFKPLKRPVLWKKKAASEGYKLDERYVYTSAGRVIHMDYSSYYPNLLRNMLAFFNPEKGRDDYARMYYLKEYYGKRIKEATDSLEILIFSLLREAIKLALNSATGAAGADHDTTIRMNNRILSMRLLGQLFCWRVGQKLTLEGGSVISTNTDGLYSADLSIDQSQAILDEEMQVNHVLIEPEELLLVSKDSNNRLEVHVSDKGTKLAGSGGTLAALHGPDIRKSLAHPAASDYALARYLSDLVQGQITDSGRTLTLADEPVRDRITQILTDLRDDESKTVAERLIFFQNIVASSPSSQTFTATLPFGALESDEALKTLSLNADGTTPIHPLSHFTRIFMVNPATSRACHLFTFGLWKIPPATATRRHRDGEMPTDHNAHAVQLLKTQSYDPAGQAPFQPYPEKTEAQLRKVSGLAVTQPVIIENRDLRLMPETESRAILQALDVEAYTQLVVDTYTGSWMNHTVSETVLTSRRTLVDTYRALLPVDLFGTTGESSSQLHRSLYDFTQKLAQLPARGKARTMGLESLTTSYRQNYDQSDWFPAFSQLAELKEMASA